MRLILIISAFLAVIVAGAFAALTVPQIAETSIEWTCSQNEPSPTCLDRMRAMGHLWSRKNNLARAQVWYERAAMQGDPASMFHLAWAYEQVGQRDLAQAARQISDREREEALMQDPAQAQALLPKGYFWRARDWYRKSAEKGFAPAMNNLAELYLSGILDRPDPDEAFRWHVAAARAGNPVAAMNVAIDYRIGRGVNPNPAEAKKWSTWTPRPDAPGMGDLTLARTTLFGVSIPPDRRALIRAAADKQIPVLMEMQPLKRDPRLPTFEQVKRQLQN